MPDVAVDPTGITYVTNFNSAKVDVYDPPLTGTTPIAFSVTVGTHPQGLDVDSSGNLYVGNEGSGDVTIYDAPLSGSSTAAATISSGLTAPVGVKVDSAGNLYVADSGKVQIYHPPFSNASAPAVTITVAGVFGVFVDKPTGNLWVAAGATVKEFTPPFSNASTPALTITNGLTSPDYPALDPSGDLFVSDSVHVVRVFLAPLSAASSPAFSIAILSDNGIAFGR